MSYTDGMDKTPGQRQHNRGWFKLARDGRRAEALDRAAKHHPVTSDEAVEILKEGASDE